MTHMELFSEPFASTGNIAGEGFGNLLGRPTLGMIQTVIRESIQNSIDAARVGVGPSVLMRVRTLKPAELAALRDRVTTQLPSECDSRDRLSKSLGKATLRVMEISDFSTTGLGGPLSADEPAHEESPDFVNFVRNVGAARDTDQGGGTYGYGKTVFYRMSRCSTILLDTMATDKGNKQRRFIGCHLGTAFDGEDTEGSKRRYTGRHWWGNRSSPDTIDPLLDEFAEVMAGQLGMPPRSGEDTGTTVMILDPLFDSDNDHDVFDELAETLLWNFWPRMIHSTPGARRLRVSIEIEGKEWPLPAPEDFPPLDHFAEALDVIHDSPAAAEEVWSRRPKAMLGHLAFSKGYRLERTGPATRNDPLTPKRSAHIALMRPVELVVRYLEGTPFPDERFEWAGVFVCSDEQEVEEAFARAEPPAHDDWLYENLPRGRQKTFVKVGLERLKRRAVDYASPRSSVDDDDEGPSLAKTATILGKMLGSGEGQSPGHPRRVGTPSRRKKSPPGVSSPVFECLEQDSESEVCAVFSATLSGIEPGQHVHADPYLVMDGGQAPAVGLGQDYAVTVIDMTIAESGRTVTGDFINPEKEDGTLKIRVAMPPSAAVGLRLTLSGGGS